MSRLCLMAGMVWCGIAVAEEATPPPNPAAPAADDFVVTLPPPPGPVASAPPTMAIPKPSKPVDIPIAPVVTRVVRSPRPRVEPDSSGSYGGFNDWRLSWTGGASAYTLEYDDLAYNLVRETGTFDSTGRLVIQWIGSPGFTRGGGLMLGAYGAYQWNDGELNGGAELSVRSWTLGLQLGYGIPIGRNIQLEAVPFAGLGGISGTVEGPIGPESVSGFVFEWGILFNGMYTFDGGFQVGLTGGFLGFSGTAEDSANYDGTSYTLSANGGVGGVTIGVRF